MSMFTPTASSQFLAGMGLWSVVWSALYKIEKIAKLIHCDKWVNRDKILDWMGENKAITLIGTECVNFGVHGVENPSSVTFALGGTFLNFWMIFGWLNIRGWRKRQQQQANAFRV